jgi:glycosyltransferase involved in cell wall biosynthesis
MKILYDASILAGNYKHGTSRTGIFWVAYNILQKISENKMFDIVLRISSEYKWALPYFKNDRYFKKFHYIVDYDLEIKKNIIYIREYMQKILKTLNPIKLVWYILKIFWNTFRLLILIIEDMVNSSLKYFDVYFSPLFPIPDKINKIDSIKKFIILYDIAPIKFPLYFPDSKDNNYWYNILTNSLDKNLYCFCISENTKNDFLTHFNSQLDKNKMFVTYIATAQIFYPNYDIEKLHNTLLKYNIHHKPNDKYVFSLCTLEPRKNLIFTIQCFMAFIKKNNIQDLYFYLGGTQWDFFINTFKKQFIKFGEYRNKIVRLGYIDDEDVNILYSNSLFFAYISQYEGFGMPPLEAMQAGVPVITSNNSSLPEVVGDAAITIDCDSEEQCIKAFEDLYFKEDLRKLYIKKGLERAKMFSWERTVKLMSDIIINT